MITSTQAYDFAHSVRETERETDTTVTDIRTNGTLMLFSVNGLFVVKDRDTAFSRFSQIGRYSPKKETSAEVFMFTRDLQNPDDEQILGVVLARDPEAYGWTVSNLTLDGTKDTSDKEPEGTDDTKDAAATNTIAQKIHAGGDVSRITKPVLLATLKKIGGNPDSTDTKDDLIRKVKDLTD